MREGAREVRHGARKGAIGVKSLEFYVRENAFIARQGTYDLLYLDVKPPGRLYP